MLQKILKFFGLTTLKNLKIEQDKNQLLIEENQQLKQQYNNLFDFDCFKPKITYAQYCNELNTNPQLNKKLWNDYWDLYYKDNETAFKLRKLSLEPKLLSEFLYKFSNFHWSQVYVIMKNMNWKWRDSENTPTISELKDCVISLIDTSDYTLNGYVESGGFKVKVCYDENQQPIYNIIGSMCKSGIFIKADILKYHENDIREVEHKENGVIVLGPYK